MEYRNTITGAVVISDCEISGGDWVKVATAETVVEKPKAPAKKKAKKNGLPE